MLRNSIKNFVVFSGLFLSAFAGSGELGLNKEFKIIGQGTHGPYFLGETNLIENSETISQDTTLFIKNKDYWIDYHSGEINFSRSLHPADTLKVVCSSELIGLKKRYFHRELLFNTKLASSIPQVIENKPSVGNFSTSEPNLNLRLQGNKTVAVQLNSTKDFSLQQSLNLALSGQITSDVEIKALLSDQNLPLASDENTRKFDELDKLSLNFFSPFFSASLGDLQAQSGGITEPNLLSGTNLVSYHKRLKGVQSSLNKGKLAVDVTVADSKGKNFSYQFKGEDGKQGPYVLKAENGNPLVNLIPGSEKVWLDGRLLSRGSDYDYTLDYEQGFIVFTPKQIITSQSQILVDFEYSEENYASDFFASRAIIKLKEEKLVWGATFVNEKDDQNHPTGFGLSAEDRLILNQAGDQAHQAFRSGADYVGENQGSYNLAQDSLGNEYYQYSGQNLGSYEVSFSYVGYKQGSYLSDGSVGFKYVYPGNGDYQAVVFLPLPQNQSLIATDMNYAPVENLQLKAEYAKSLKDLNTLSNLDDNDNSGEALASSFLFQKKDFSFLNSNWSILKSQASLRIISNNFAPLSRIIPVDRQKNWNLPLDSKSGNEKSFEIDNQFSPKEKFSADFGFGSIKSEGNFSAKRESYGITVPFFLSGRLGLNQQRVKIKEAVFDSASSLEFHNKRDQTRKQISLQQFVKGVRVNSSWEKEENESQILNQLTSQKFHKFKIRVSSDNFGKTSFASELQKRQTSTSTVNYSSNLYLWQNQMSLRNWKQTLSGTLEFTTQISQIPSQKTHRTNLASLKLELIPPSQVTLLELRYLINQTGLAQNSNLKWDSTSGPYSHMDSQSVAVSDRSTLFSATLFAKSLHWVFSPHKLNQSPKSFWSSFLSSLYTDTYLTLEEQAPPQKRNWSNWFWPWSNLKADSIYIKNYSFQQEINLTPLNFRHFFKFKLGKNRFENKLNSAGEFRREENQKVFSGNFNLGRNFLVQAEQTWSVKKQDLAGYLNYQVKGQQTSLTVTRRNLVITEISGGVLYLKEKEKINRISSEELGLKLRLAQSVANRGKVSGEAKWSEVSFRPRISNAWYLAGGKKAGGNWELNFNLNYKISQNFNYLVSYQSQKNSYFKNKNLFRMELRANF